jgi:hypothetical protein
MPLVNALNRTHLKGVVLKELIVPAASRTLPASPRAGPELWRDICLMNRRALGRSLSDYIKYLEQLNRWIPRRKGRLAGKGIYARL